MCQRCRELLSQGLNLCVRARDMDARDRHNAELAISSDPDGWVESGQFDRHITRRAFTEHLQHAPISRSGTIHLWMIEQYDKDLFEWEKAARAHLLQCDASELRPAISGKAGE